MGRKNKHKKLVVFAIEKKDKGVSRMYGKVIEKATTKELGNFMRQKIVPNAKIKTDEWTGYKPLAYEFKHLKRVKSGEEGENFTDMHRIIMGFKGWLRGIHHHVDYLQAYIDEYCYRFNRNKMKAGIFENLISRMVHANPYPYKLMSLSNA